MSGGSLDYAYQKLFNVLDHEAWADFERDYPKSARMVKYQIENLAGMLRAIEWETSGDGAFPHSLNDDALRAWLLKQSYADPYER